MTDIPTEVFKFDLIDLEYEFNIEEKESVVEFYDHHIRIKLAYHTDEYIDEDKSLGTQRVFCRQDEIILKSAIVMVTRTFISNKDFWKVKLMVNGGDDIRFYFKDREKSLIFQNKLLNYLLVGK